MIGGLYNSYEDYLLSDMWKDKSKIMIDKYKICQLCFTEKYLIVHHKTYENITNEGKNDLIVLCRKCHNKIHILKKQDKDFTTINNNNNFPIDVFDEVDIYGTR